MNPPFSVTGLQLETQDLVLRPFREDDLNDFYAYASVPGVGEAAGWKHHGSIDESRIILQSFIQKKENLALVHKSCGRVIGSIALRSCWSSRNVHYQHLLAKELGYVLAKSHWGRGLATQAARAVISHGFHVLLLDAVGAAHAPQNTKSRRVLEKCGFAYIETGTYYSKTLQQQMDDVRYLLMREAFLKSGNGEVPK